MPRENIIRSTATPMCAPLGSWARLSSSSCQVGTLSCRPFPASIVSSAAGTLRCRWSTPYLPNLPAGKGRGLVASEGVMPGELLVLSPALACLEGDWQSEPEPEDLQTAMLEAGLSCAQRRVLDMMYDGSEASSSRHASLATLDTKFWAARGKADPQAPQARACIWWWTRHRVGTRLKARLRGTHCRSAQAACCPSSTSARAPTANKMARSPRYAWLHGWRSPACPLVTDTVLRACIR
jgi:hypothetical protein